MCDKLQSSKDGNIDLCHSRLAECSSHGSQHYSSSSSNGKVISNKKQKHYKGDYQSSRSQEYDSSPMDKRRRHNAGHNGRRWNRPDKERRGGGRQESGVNESSPGQLSPHVSGRKESVKKKVPTMSLNHLLNFTVASSSRYDSGSAGTRPFARHRRRNTSHTYNKEEFLQANCQFVVSASGDYTVHARDPDKLVEWQQIEQVRLFCHEIPSCPICLYPPKTAKITRCGHVYCWACLLHYLCLSDKKWSKCPICNESIYRQDIKSVVALSSPQYKVGDTITMKLMAREKGATQVFAKPEWTEKKDKILNIEGSCVNQFVKLLTASPAQVLSLIIEPERRALQTQLAGLGKGEDSEACFIQGALDDLKVRQDQLTQSKAIAEEVEQIVSEVQAVSSPPFPVQRSLSTPASSSVHRAGVPPRGLSKVSWKVYSDQYLETDYQAAFSDDEDASSDSFVSGGEEDIRGVAAAADEEEEDSLADPLTVDPISSSVLSSKDSSPQSAASDESSDRDTVSPVPECQDNLVYFYQASDGQHLYLHPVNTKSLTKEYGSLSTAPDEITATLVEMEQFTMSEDLRGRFRSINHLPLTCQFALCELDLKPPIVSHATLKQFSDEIHRRKQKRAKKKADDRRREKKAELANNSLENGFQNSASDLTPEKFHDFLSLATSPSLLESVTLSMGKTVQPVDLSSSPSPTATPDNDSSSPSTPSFAQALQGKTPPVWPLKQTPSKGPHASKQQSTPVRSGEDANNDDNTAVPSIQDAFDEAFKNAAQKGPEGRPGSKMAKKGRKKLVLFSTGGSRGAC